MARVRSYAINFKNDDPCVVVRGSKDSDNQIRTCDTTGWADGTSTGNGLKDYGQADDDGSKYYDWWTYHSFGSVTPSDNGVIDWSISQASMISYMKADSVLNGNSAITDYGPHAASCDSSLDVGPVSFNFSTVLCVGSGSEIVFPDDNGSFGQKQNGLFVSYSTIGFNYRVAVRIKQGVRARWYTITKAKFEKRNPFNYKEETLTSVANS